MFGAKVRVQSITNVENSITRGYREPMMDAATKGFQRSQEKAPVDRGNLIGSGVPPQERADGSIEWGYNAPYTMAIEHGTGPFTPPLEPLKEWGRRVLGSESAGVAAWQSIRENGIQPHPFIRPGIEAMRQHLRNVGVIPSIREQL